MAGNAKRNLEKKIQIDTEGKTFKNTKTAADKVYEIKF